MDIEHIYIFRMWFSSRRAGQVSFDYKSMHIYTTNLSSIQVSLNHASGAVLINDYSDDFPVLLYSVLLDS